MSCSIVIFSALQLLILAASIFLLTLIRKRELSLVFKLAVWCIVISSGLTLSLGGAKYFKKHCCKYRMEQGHESSCQPMSEGCRENNGTCSKHSGGQMACCNGGEQLMSGQCGMKEGCGGGCKGMMNDESCMGKESCSMHGGGQAGMDGAKMDCCKMKGMNMEMQADSASPQKK